MSPSSTSRTFADLLATYPGRTARDVVAALADLDDAQLEAVRAIEVASSSRITVLKRIDVLLRRTGAVDETAAEEGWADAPVIWQGPTARLDDAASQLLESTEGGAAAGNESMVTPLPGPASTVAKGRRAGWLKVAAVAVPLVAIAGVVGTRGGDSSGTRLSGTFLLTDWSEVSGDWDGCSGTGGYSDFGPGMNVTIRNGDGEIIATTATQSGSDYLDEHEDPDENDDGRGDITTLMENSGDMGFCAVRWSVEVPNDEAFYEVTIGRRGELTYSRSDLDEEDWDVFETLGN